MRDYACVVGSTAYVYDARMYGVREFGGLLVNLYDTHVLGVVFGYRVPSPQPHKQKRTRTAHQQQDTGQMEFKGTYDTHTHEQHVCVFILLVLPYTSFQFKKNLIWFLNTNLLMLSAGLVKRLSLLFRRPDGRRRVRCVVLAVSWAARAL